MTKIKILISCIVGLILISSCEEKALNPGDFSLKSELEIVQIYDTLGNSYAVDILRSIDTTFLPGNKVAKYIELDTVLVASPKNELRIKLKSNARWQAPTPDFKGKIAWYLTQNVNGGGDATIKVKILTGLTTKRRPVLANQFIYSRDSLVLYKLTFNQKAQNEQ